MTSGLMTKEERAEYQREWRRRNPERSRELQRQSYRKHRAQRLVAEMRRHRLNRPARLAQMKERRERHPEERREYMRLYMRERRAEGKGRWSRLHGEAEEYAAIIRNDPCSYCGGPGGEVDHITPRARGGEDEWGNLTGACRSCNSSKNAKTLLGFLLERAA